MLPQKRISLEEARNQLNDLIGLDGIKSEIDSLVNFLAMQKSRAEVGLPATQLVFAFGLHRQSREQERPPSHESSDKSLRSMNVLKKGQVIETDRSGLVAEFAGQTGPKTNKKIDEAIDGILFIDEAYTLIAEGNEDPYGHEAVQTLLKRMEDDRDRLVVVLAGYPQPIDRLLDSNPGLRSRFSRSIHFEDYAPEDLGRILESMCATEPVPVLNADTRARFLLGNYKRLRIARRAFRKRPTYQKSCSKMPSAVLPTASPIKLQLRKSLLTHSATRRLHKSFLRKNVGDRST